LVKKFLTRDPNFVLTINIFNKFKINYWVCQGTLLGIIRDQSLIPWDPDIDFAILKKNFDKKLIQKIMKKNGFIKKKKFFKNDNLFTFKKKGGRDVDVNIYDLDNKNEFVRTIWFVPKNLIMRLIEVLSFSKSYNGRFRLIINLLSFSESYFKLIKKSLINKKIFYKKAGYAHPYKFISKLKKKNFFGQNIIVPFFYLDYLKYMYGKNWRKPKKKYNWFKDSPSTTTFD